MNNEERYFNWLCELVNASSDKHDFLWCLFDTHFMYQLARDANRVSDGLSLRVQYAEDTGDETDISDYPCSVLEVMVALAMRAESILYDPEEGPHEPQLFWQMVENMGIKNTDNESFDYYDTMHKLHRMMGRRYSPDGKGGLFRIRGVTEDLRDVELWNQMLWYLLKYY